MAPRDPVASSWSGTTIERVGVVIPARDEAASIAECVASIDAAAAQVAVPVVIVVAADRCRDDTAARARARGTTTSAATVVVVEGRWRGAGAARRAGIDHLLATVPADDRASTWLVNTDADGVVPSDWLARHLAHAARGALVVAGEVELDADTTPAPLLAGFARQYVGDGDGPRRHVHGANLGVRADAYVAVGGFRPHTVVGEDHRLLADLAARGVAVVHAPDVVVTTSARTTSRVRGGFASRLAALDVPA